MSSGVHRRGPVGSSMTFGAVLLVFASIGVTFSDRDGSNDKSKQLTVEVFNSTSIALRWSEPKRPIGDRSCPVQRYVIRLKQDGQKQARTWRFDGARLSVTLHDLRPATVYQVRLLSFDCENKRKTSRWTRVATSERPSVTTAAHETRAPSKPTEVRTITMAESVVATWRPPEDGAIVRGYIVGYGEGVPDVNWRYVNASQRNVTLRNLKPKTRYVISVRAFNNIGKGQVIYDIVSTKEAPVSPVGAGASGVLPAPTHLRSRMLSPTTTLLQWSDPSLDPTTQRIADERYYNVYYQSLPAGKNLSVIVKALQVTLYDLLPSKGYRFTVRTIKGSSTSPFSVAVIGRTPNAGSSESQRKTSETTKAKPTSPTTDETNNNNDDDDDDDNDDDDDYDIERQDVYVIDRTGTGTGTGTGNGVIDGGGVGEPKAKRANTVVHQSLARTLTSSSAANASSSSMTSSSDVRIAFRFAVQYRVSAYVTWPEERLVPCPSASSSDDVRTTTSGYLFRYRSVDDDVDDYVIRSLTSNFVVLENLVPNTRYKYQVKYLEDRGGGSAPGWSQEATLDTSYNGQ